MLGLGAGGLALSSSGLSATWSKVTPRSQGTSDIKSETALKGLTDGNSFDIEGMSNTLLSVNDGGPINIQNTELSIEEVSSVASPSSGFNKLYFKSDDLLYKQDSDGNEKLVEEQVELYTTTVTATGGSQPAVDTTITGISPTQDESLTIDVYVDSDPSFNANYAFNYDYSLQWDDANSQLDLLLTVNWDTDPGSGNDVTLRVEVNKV